MSDVNFEQLVEKSDTFEVKRHEGSKKLIIFFSATGAKPGTFNFWKEGNKLPVHRLFINNGYNEWYQNGVPGLGNSVESTVEAIRALAARLEVDEIYTCGGSMGAYAAILYGTMLGAKVLSFAAETLLGIPGSRSVTHIRKGTKYVYPDLTDHILRSEKPIFHFVGESDPVDVYCASKLPKCPNLSIRTLRGVAHGPPRYLLQVGLLPAFLNSFVANEPLPETPADGNILEKTSFPDLYLQAFQASKREDWASVVMYGGAALQAHPTSDFCNFLVGRAMIKLGRTEEGLRYVSTARSLASDIIEYYNDILNTLALCLRSLGAHMHAAEIYQDAIRRDEKDHRAHYGLSLTLLKLNKPEIAAEHFATAIRLSPGNPAYKKRLGEFKKVAKLPGL